MVNLYFYLDSSCGRLLRHVALALWMGQALLSLPSSAAVVINNLPEDKAVSPKNAPSGTTLSKEGRRILRNDDSSGSTMFGPNPQEGALRLPAGQETPEQSYMAGLEQYHTRTAAGMPSYGRAIEYWRRAAQAEEPRALTALSYLYLRGLGVQRDVEEARRLANRAVALGNPRAYFILAEILADEGDGIAAIAMLERGGLLEDALALNELGVRSELGDSMPRDLARAQDYYRRSVRSGSKTAQRNLLRVTGSSRDRNDVIERYTTVKALAGTGDRVAMYNLGLMHHTGTGTGINYLQALDWYQRSAAKNYFKAKNMLQLIFSRSVPGGTLDAPWMRQIAVSILRQRSDLNFTYEGAPERADLFE